MRGASLLIWVLCLLAARACFASPLVWPLTTPSDDKHTLLVDEYPVVNLATPGITGESYRAFIAEIRERLQNPGDIRFGIPVLRSRTNVPISERFVLVHLSNWAGQSVTLALDVINVYVVGYRAGNYSVFLMPDSDEVATAITHLFTDTTRRPTLHFGGGYPDLGDIRSGLNRTSVELGAQALEQAVSAMYVYAQGPSYLLEASLARAFFVTIQMVSEATRFRYIETEMYRRIQQNQNTYPDVSVIEVENSWDDLSSAIQLSNQGMLRRPVQLQRRGGELFHVDNVEVVRGIIALMLFTCNPRPPQGSLHLSPLIRLILSKSDDPDSTCPEDQPEPTVQIAGPGGLCADVRDGRYNNGNPIQLYPCKSVGSSNNVNQLWTFKRDGTLRSNGKCLGTYGYTPGDYIMIYDCDVTDNFKWQVWDNGTIVSRVGLVLAASSLESGKTLTAEVNTYTIGQSWLPSNITNPLVAPIVGLSSGLCLQAKGADLLLETCVSREADQAWALYPDGSIRPNQTRLDSCLTVPSKGSSVKIALCEPNSSLQRWVFPNDGTIMNLETQLVMDMTPGSIPSLSEIIVASFTGNPSQMWQALMLL